MLSIEFVGKKSGEISRGIADGAWRVIKDILGDYLEESEEQKKNKGFVEDFYYEILERFSRIIDVTVLGVIHGKVSKGVLEQISRVKKKHGGF